MGYSISKLPVFVVLAAVLAAPQQRRACCDVGGESTGCCSRQVPPQTTAAHCCQPSIDSDRCGDDAYPCCRSADPRTASSDRPAGPVPTGAGATLWAFDATVPEPPTSVFCSPSPPAGRTIPLRILDCSWLI